jgi:hypothetical protein
VYNPQLGPLHPEAAKQLFDVVMEIGFVTPEAAAAFMSEPKDCQASWWDPLDKIFKFSIDRVMKIQEQFKDDDFKSNTVRTVDVGEFEATQPFLKYLQDYCDNILNPPVRQAKTSPIKRSRKQVSRAPPPVQVKKAVPKKPKQLATKPRKPYVRKQRQSKSSNSKLLGEFVEAQIQQVQQQPPPLPPVQQPLTFCPPPLPVHHQMTNNQPSFDFNCNYFDNHYMPQPPIEQQMASLTNEIVFGNDPGLLSF